MATYQGVDIIYGVRVSHPSNELIKAANNNDLKTYYFDSRYEGTGLFPVDHGVQEGQVVYIGDKLYYHCSIHELGEPFEYDINQPRIQGRLFRSGITDVPKVYIINSSR